MMPSTPPVPFVTRALTVIALGAVLAQCGPEPCVENLPSDCAPLYAPVFDEIFARTLKPTCSPSGGQCHARAGAKGDLVLDEIETAYRALRGNDGNDPRVLPGDVACSELVKRIESDEKDRVMPPGKPLSQEERCVLRQWVAAGAPR